MNKLKNLIWIMFIFVLCGLAFVLYKTAHKNTPTENMPQIFSQDFITHNDSFSDGLNDPDSVTKYQLDDLDMGLSEKYIYYVDINNDKVLDRITKSFIETGNAHSYYEYKIELNVNGKYVDITPKNFRTTNGDTCDLQQIQFVFKPSFRVNLIYRELGETWTQPTVAKKQVFKLSDNKLESSDTQTLRPICDVKELF